MLLVTLITDNLSDLSCSINFLYTELDILQKLCLDYLPLNIMWKVYGQREIIGVESNFCSTFFLFLPLVKIAMQSSQKSHKLHINKTLV